MKQYLEKSLIVAFSLLFLPIQGSSSNNSDSQNTVKNIINYAKQDNYHQLEKILNKKSKFLDFNQPYKNLNQVDFELDNDTDDTDDIYDIYDTDDMYDTDSYEENPKNLFEYIFSKIWGKIYDVSILYLFFVYGTKKETLYHALKKRRQTFLHQIFRTSRKIQFLVNFNEPKCLALMKFFITQTKNNGYINSSSDDNQNLLALFILFIVKANKSLRKNDRCKLTTNFIGTVLKALLVEGVNPNQKNKFTGETAFHLLCSNATLTEYCSLFLQYDANPNIQKYKSSITPACLAFNHILLIDYKRSGLTDEEANDLKCLKEGLSLQFVLNGANLAVDGSGVLMSLLEEKIGVELFFKRIQRVVEYYIQQHITPFNTNWVKHHFMKIIYQLILDHITYKKLVELNLFTKEEKDFKQKKLKRLQELIPQSQIDLIKKNEEQHLEWFGSYPNPTKQRRK